MNANEFNKNQQNIDAYVERLMRDSTPDRPLWNVELLTIDKTPKWHYVDGCMMKALLDLWETTQDDNYLHFVDSFVDFYVFEDGSIRGFKKEEYALDSIAEGRILYTLYEKTHKEKYLKAIEVLNEQLIEQPKTVEGVYWHKKIYPNQVWLDGLYMAQPFRALYGQKVQPKQKNDIYEDIVHQLSVVREKQFCPEKGLYFHAYDASKSAFWADKTTGHSANFWLRALGWFFIALVDLYDLMKEDADPTLLDTIKALYLELADGLLPYQDKASKMFCQVVDLPSGDVGAKNGKLNYAETSGSAMISYALLKGARLGLFGDGAEKYTEEALEVFDGICQSELSFEDENGQKALHLDGICIMAGVGPDSKPHRDGSLEYYLSEPIVKNDAKGVAPFLMCYAEVKRFFAS